MDNKQNVSDHRTQIYLPEALYKKLKRQSRKEEVSMAQFIRTALEEKFKNVSYSYEDRQEKGRSRVMDAAGGIRSRKSALSPRRDAHPVDLTREGELVIPKKLRDKYNLKECDKVYLVEGEDFIKLKPARDILDLAGKIKPKKDKSALDAREEMERRYQRS